MGIMDVSLSFRKIPVSFNAPVPTLVPSTKKVAADLVAGANTGFFSKLLCSTGSATHINSLVGRISAKNRVDGKAITKLMKAVEKRTGSKDVASLVAALLRAQNKPELKTLIKAFEAKHNVGLLNHKHARKVAIGTAVVASAALIGSGIYFRNEILAGGQVALEKMNQAYAYVTGLFSKSSEQPKTEQPKTEQPKTEQTV